MRGKIVSFGDKKVKKSKFYKNKKAFKIYDIDINKILVSKEEPYSSNKLVKCFIGYNDNDDIRPLCIIFFQIIGFVKKFDNKKTMSFKVTDNKLSKRTPKYGKKVKNLLNIKIDSEPVYGNNDEYIITNIKIYRDKVNTNFHYQKIPKEKN